MRRPDPLPSSPRAAEPDAPDAAGNDAATRRRRMAQLGIDADAAAARRRGDVADAAATAPIAVPDGHGGPVRRSRRRSSRRTERRDQGAPSDDRSTREPPEAGDDAEATTWRDVWRATRARRRVMRAEVRRFTVRARRRRRIWLVSLAAIGLLVVGSLGAAYSPLFAVETITVEGADQLDVAAVEDALSDQIGTALPLVDHDSVQSALAAFPLIETYSLEAHPPHDLVVRVVERTPVGVVQSDEGFTTVDAAGVALATAAEQPDGLPLIDAGETTGAAFAAVGQVLRSLPDDLLAQVSAAKATTAEDVALTLGATGTEVVWGSAEQSAQKVEVLTAAMAKLPADQVSTYDVSAPGSLIVR